MYARRRLRLVAPVAVVGLIALGSWVPTLSASASPHLPAISAQALVVKAETADVRHFSGNVRWSADLGLPSLSDLTGGQGSASASAFDPTELLSGTHDFAVAVGGPSQLRVSTASPLSESDLVVNGTQAWISEASTGHVRHIVAAPGQGRHQFGRRGFGKHGYGEHHFGRAPTPASVAQQFLARLRSGGTVITTSAPVMVAGRAAYQLRLAPDRNTAAGADSTVSSVVISVDATTGMVLAVAVHALGQSAPALSIGFTSLSYAAPPTSDFAPLHGITESTTVEHHGRGRSGEATGPGAWSDGTWSGSGWDTVLTVPADRGAKLLGHNPRLLQSITTEVSGSWGSGRLLRSSLLDALVLPDGRILVGFVSPAALEHAATTATRH